MGLWLQSLGPARVASLDASVLLEPVPLGIALGLFVSAFARTEFQAVQFMPLFIFPQIIVCGLFVPIDKLPDVLQSIAWWMPLTYLVEALNGVTQYVDVTETMWRDLWIVAVYIIVAIVFAGLTLRRKTQ